MRMRRILRLDSWPTILLDIGDDDEEDICAPRHPGCPISRELDYASRHAWDGSGGCHRGDYIHACFDGGNARDDRSELTRPSQLLYCEAYSPFILAVWSSERLGMASGGLGIFYGTSCDGATDTDWLSFRGSREQTEGQGTARCTRGGFDIGTRGKAPETHEVQGPVTTTPPPVTKTLLPTLRSQCQLQAMNNEGVRMHLQPRDTTRNGDDSHSSGVGIRRPVQVARECTYPDFLKCQPLNFKGTEGVVGLTRWFEKMEVCVLVITQLHNS
ncbi:hypothetical protein Tco_0743690 [Tanacetum coccineum]